MTTTSRLQAILGEWLVNMTLASFEFSAGFRVQFESRETDEIDRPKVMILEIKSMSHIGEIDEWNNLVESLPKASRRTERHEPAFAYGLMLLVGVTVNAVRVEQDSTLIIETSDGESITIAGRDDVWEESWILAEPEDVAGVAAKFAACDSQGAISCSLDSPWRSC
ncbi:hypothetical protein J2T57_001112 [Natronocella acetinitrilica]|uniref:Uncharacterized protein n=1 Tax=Natronocella acetinitrilica TaxID=414046 RepID=A0AAE3KBS9_9GAMM|nr:hypothetical protein [Natronocella acetinitrilica]MCP1674013.1 hypothetical protein [Natronocella acetinitrilica]